MGLSIIADRSIFPGLTVEPLFSDEYAHMLLYWQILRHGTHFPYSQFLFNSSFLTWKWPCVCFSGLIAVCKYTAGSLLYMQYDQVLNSLAFEFVSQLDDNLKELMLTRHFEDVWQVRKRPLYFPFSYYVVRLLMIQLQLSWHTYILLHPFPHKTSPCSCHSAYKTVLLCVSRDCFWRGHGLVWCSQ